MNENNILSTGNINICYGFDKNYNIDEIISYWNENDCITPLENTLNNKTINGVQSFLYNEDSLNSSQLFINTLFNLYLNKYNFISDINDIKFNKFQYKLLDVCLTSSLPGVCDNFLNFYCPNELIKDNPFITNLCGCYVKTNVDPPQCDRNCARASTIQKSNKITGKLIKCSPKVCAISNNNINFLNSQVNGNLNFTNFCPGCQGNECVCIISSNDINQTIYDLGISTTINQFCGPDSICQVLDGDKVISSSSCQSLNNESINQIINNKVKIKYPIFLIFIICLIIIIIIILFILFKIYLK